MLSNALLISLLAAGSLNVNALSFPEFSGLRARASQGRLSDGQVNSYPVDRQGKKVSLSKRDDPPSTEDLLNSCPGGSGSSLPTAHVCWYVHDSDNGNGYDKKVELDDVKRLENCGGGQGDLTETISGTHSWSNGYSISTKTEVKFFMISASLNEKTAHSTTQANVTGYSMVIPPGKKGTLQTSQHFQPSFGKININYGEHDKVAGHWNWEVSGVASDEIRGPPIVGSVELNCSDNYPF